MKRRGFLATLAAIACAPIAAVKKAVLPTPVRSSVITVTEPHDDDCGGFIVPAEFHAVLITQFQGDVTVVYERKLEPPLTLREVCRLRGVEFKEDVT